MGFSARVDLDKKIAAKASKALSRLCSDDEQHWAETSTGKALVLPSFNQGLDVLLDTLETIDRSKWRLIWCQKSAFKKVTVLGELQNCPGPEFIYYPDPSFELDKDSIFAEKSNFDGKLYCAMTIMPEMEANYFEAYLKRTSISHIRQITDFGLSRFMAFNLADRDEEDEKISANQFRLIHLYLKYWGSRKFKALLFLQTDPVTNENIKNGVKGFASEFYGEMDTEGLDSGFSRHLTS